jgi:ribokinase
MSIVVVGSLNQDIVARVERHPLPGETVLSHGHFVAPGGKGGNQAVAAARLGQSVAMVGRVGADAAGRDMVAALLADGVDVTHVLTDEGATGVALITLDDAGENAIVVSPGANARLTAADVEDAAPLVSAASVVLLQLEVPLEAVAAAAALATGTVVLNPAPARPLPASLLERITVLVPNRSELGILAGQEEPHDVAAAAALASRVAPTVVVTLGEDGAILVRGDDCLHVPAPPVVPVDTTAAGDAFCGALADGMARGHPLDEAVRWAVAAGAAATTRLGAQPSLPSRRHVESLLGA